MADGGLVRLLLDEVSCSDAAPTTADIVLAASPDRLSDLEVSSGTEGAWSRQADPLGYYALEARIPRGPWQSAALKQKRVSTSPVAKTIAVLPPSSTLLAVAATLGVDRISSLDQCDAFNESPDHGTLSRAVQEAFSSSILSTDKPRSLGLRIGEPEMPTTTWDYSAKVQLGLHVDDWDRMSLTQRESARNRLCVNLGSERRFLLFVPLSMRRLLELLDVNDEDVQHLDPILRFFDAFPEYPVCRISIAPGEAYIAPTENIVHDGSTLGSSSVDRCLAMLGRFELRQERS
jgi:hypothetical protein